MSFRERLEKSKEVSQSIRPQKPFSDVQSFLEYRAYLKNPSLPETTKTRISELVNGYTDSITPILEVFSSVLADNEGKITTHIWNWGKDTKGPVTLSDVDVGYGFKVANLQNMPYFDEYGSFLSSRSPITERDDLERLDYQILWGSFGIVHTLTCNEWQDNSGPIFNLSGASGLVVVAEAEKAPGEEEFRITTKYALSGGSPSNKVKIDAQFGEDNWDDSVKESLIELTKTGTFELEFKKRLKNGTIFRKGMFTPPLPREGEVGGI